MRRKRPATSARWQRQRPPALPAQSDRPASRAVAGGAGCPSTSRALSWGILGADECAVRLRLRDLRGRLLVLVTILPWLCGAAKESALCQLVGNAQGNERSPDV